MAEHNDKIKNHVQAARDWLGKAERSLDQQNEFKSNLNLMLAQAELQRAKETNCSSVAWFSQSGVLIRSIAIIVAIGLMIAVGFSGFGAKKATAPLENIPHNRIESSPALPVQAPVQREPEQMSEEKMAVEHKPEVMQEPTAPPVVQPEIPAAQDQSARNVQSEEKAAISAEEMQQLMRSAGKSLRGQN